MNDKIRIKRLNKLAIIPEYQTDGAAAVDLHASISGSIDIYSRKSILFPTGLSIQIPTGLCGIILPRSGLGYKKGLVLAHGVGVIDSDYRGEIGVPIWNRGSITRTVNPGDRIAQMLFIPVFKIMFEEVEELDSTIRGNGGFGSTGILHEKNK